MYRDISELILYSDLGEDSILVRLGDIFRRWENGGEYGPDLIRDIYAQIKRLLDLSTQYAFDENLWHDYLTYVLLTNENSFSLTCERTGAAEGGSVNELAKHDFRVFKRLFDFDFGPIETALDIRCFSTVCAYRAIAKRASIYNGDVSALVRQTSRAIDAAKDENEVFDIVTAFYRDHGVGVFGFNRAFRIAGSGPELRLQPINNIGSVTLSDIVGYEAQKKELTANTEAFLAGKGANNVLLYGDAGTGKSTSVKALLNDYRETPLRMVEIYKHQFRDLSELMARIKNRNYRFIIFIDDLSFEENETEYKFLKAVIEGGVETRPDNILIYATSNRRHLIRETWKDRSDMEHDGDVHRSDTIEEKLSLASRFGAAICYSTPAREQYHDIVKALAARCPSIALPEEELLYGADRWELRHGGLSGRTAQQYVNYLAGQGPVNK